MTTQLATPPPATPALPDRVQRVLAAVAVLPVLATVYQTLVLTDVTDDVIRKGIEGDSYQMIWTNACWGVAVLYGVFAGIWGMARYGARSTLTVGLAWFALGNVLCGAAVGLPSMAAAKLVEGVGKGTTIVLCRATLYRQFDKAVMTAIGLYGVIAYATRPSTPLVTAWINDFLSWRWIFWVNAPVALLGLALVRRYFRPDRPPRPLPLRIDWVSVTLLAAWTVSLLFAFGWYRKWGGWSSNAFAATVVLAAVLPVLLVVRVGGGFTPDEHLRRMFRVRVYVLAMCTRTLLLLNLMAVLTLMAKYLVGLRDYPREVAGWILAPASVTMVASTFLTTYFHRRTLRHVWLLVAVTGGASVLWWMSSVDDFTPKETVAWMVACWGAFVGLLPPVFLTDEVESLDRRDSLYGGAVAVVCLIVPLIVIPVMTSTVVSVWTDRAVDAERQNLREERPAVHEATERLTDYYRQRGAAGPELAQLSSTALGSFVKAESVARGIRSGFRFLSLATGAIGLLIAGLLIVRPSKPLTPVTR